MELKTYCANMKGDVASWKAKADDLMMKVYGSHSQAEETIARSMGRMGGMIDDLERKIERLGAECPGSWDKEKADIEKNISGMNEIWEEAWRRASARSPDDF
jgi:hypothetical protein